MKTIYFATSNKGKVKNAKKALKNFGFSVKQISIELAESRAEDPAEIALEKARQAFAKLKHPVMVEDSGFFIKTLGGFPMTHIKFSLKTLGIKNILAMLKNKKDRRAEWRMTVAYVWDKNKFKTFTFIETGKIALRPRPIKRPMMSDYWRLYIPTMLGGKKALSEMTDQDLIDWQKFYSEHNHFMMLGEWLKKTKEQ